MSLQRPLEGEHQYFLLEDPAGQPFPIYFKTITSWDAFEYILADRFKGKKGARRVEQEIYDKRYMLKEHTTGMEVDRSRGWNGAFQPYQKVDMSQYAGIRWSHSVAPGAFPFQ